MSPRCWTKLKKTYPKLFNIRPDSPFYVYGFQCDKGWIGLIDKACKGIITVCSDYNIDVRIAQIKNKLGCLRIYYDIISLSDDADRNTDALDLISDILLDCEGISTAVCEICGGNGTLAKFAKLTPRCEEHSDDL